MTTDQVRSDLGRTGVLQTHIGDVGHISDYWRSQILELCAALDAAPQDAGRQLILAQQQIARLAAEAERLEDAVAYLVAQAEAGSDEAIREQHRASEAVLLVEQAIPRMQTLNNQMSPGWLARAGDLLEDK